MTDILIRDVSDAALAEIDRLAAEAEISRNEYLRRWVNNGFRQTAKVHEPIWLVSPKWPRTWPTRRSCARHGRERAAMADR